MSDDRGPALAVERPAEEGPGAFFGVGLAAALTIYYLSSDFVALASLTVAGCLGALSLGSFANWARGRPADADSPGWAVRLAQVAFGVGLGLLALESGLALLAFAGARYWETPPRRLTDLAFPPAWTLRQLQEPGVNRSFRWHGELHLLNQDGFRRKGDYLLDENAFRIAVLGDSFTYGQGVGAEEAHPAVLQRALSGRGRIQVFNLGVPGTDSADHVQAASRYLGSLAPHLVLLGLNLDDFGVSGPRPRPQPPYSPRFCFPAPWFLVAPFAECTLVGRLWSSEYDRLLRRSGLRQDLVMRVFEDFNAHIARFGADLAELNRLGTEMTGQPVVSMVLDPVPQPFDTDRSRLARLAEDAARDAQMEVLPHETFRSEFVGRATELTVSRWEGHPSAFAHQIWGKLFADAVEAHPRFQRWLAAR